MGKLKNIKETGFKTPKNYFGSIEDSVMTKIQPNNIELNLEAPGFDMPKDYFETIEDRVFDRLKQDNESVKVVSLFTTRNILYVSGIAAAIVILFGVFNTKVNETPEDLNYEMVENYILDQNISTYELASLLTNEELLEINSDIMDEAFGDDSLEDYLLENANIEDIIEQ